MRKVVLVLFIILMIGMLVLEVATVVDLLNDRQPLLWIDEIYQ